MKRKKAKEQHEDVVTEEQRVDDTSGGNPAGAEPETEFETELDPVEKMRQERDQLENQLQRTLADLANFRKRRVQEMADARRSSIEALVGEMLPVLDNFHLAVDYESGASQTTEEKLTSIREGLLMIRSLLEGVFERHGVTEIPAQGERFDPAVHEALGIDPNPDAEEGVITQVMQRGYKVDDRILRPTRVIVGGAPTADPADATAGEPEQPEG